MSIRVRRARLKDMDYIRRLAIESVAWGIPHTRDVTADFVRAQASVNLQGIEMVLMRPDFETLLAEDVTVAEGDGAESARPVGYIMLDLGHKEPSTGERQCMIHDLAVQQDYWGRFVVNRLIRRAAEITAERGLTYLVGEVSHANERSLGTALKGLGFEVERYQIVRRVDRDDAGRNKRGQALPQGPRRQPGT